MIGIHIESKKLCWTTENALIEPLHALDDRCMMVCMRTVLMMVPPTSTAGGSTVCLWVAPCLHVALPGRLLLLLPPPNTIWCSSGCP